MNRIGSAARAVPIAAAESPSTPNPRRDNVISKTFLPRPPVTRTISLFADLALIDGDESEPRLTLPPGPVNPPPRGRSSTDGR
jgi:hypothetical protein